MSSDPDEPVDDWLADDVAPTESDVEEVIREILDGAAVASCPVHLDRFDARVQAETLDQEQIDQLNDIGFDIEVRPSAVEVGDGYRPDLRLVLRAGGRDE